MKENGGTFRKYFKYIFVNVSVAAILTLLLSTYVASAYKIQGHSMDTVLSNNERIIISKLPIKEASLNRFDIVVLHKPDSPSQSIIKRIIGLPGETIEIQEGDVYVNGQRLEQPFLKSDKGLFELNMNVPRVTIPAGHYYLLGDNRRVSRDSRSFGTVPVHYIYGKSIFRYWPLARLGKIE